MFYVENRSLKSIPGVKMGASMRDPNFWKGIFFPCIEGNGFIFALGKGMIFSVLALGNFKILIFHTSNVGFVPSNITYDT